MQLYGMLYSSISPSLTSQLSDVVYYDGQTPQTLSGKVEFRQDATAIVTSINPRYGDIAGGQTLTLTGTNLGGVGPKVTIDGIDCPITSSSATTIVRTTGARPTTPTVDNTFEVYVGSSKVILRDTFLYVLKWSSAATWGVDTAPVENDLVVIPTGTTLLVDQDTPILEGITGNGGTLVFDSTKDITVQAGFILMNGGKFIAGT